MSHNISWVYKTKRKYRALAANIKGCYDRLINILVIMAECFYTFFYIRRSEHGEDSNAC